MGDWSISYAQKPLGSAVHGIILVRDGEGNIVRSLEGLAVDDRGNPKPIGTSSGDRIRVFDTRGISGNYDTTFPEQLSSADRNAMS